MRAVLLELLQLRIGVLQPLLQPLLQRLQVALRLVLHMAECGRSGLGRACNLVAHGARSRAQLGGHLGQLRRRELRGLTHGLDTLGALGHLHLRLRLELAVGRRELLYEIVDLHLQLGLHLLLGLRARIHLRLQRVSRLRERLICRVEARVVLHESLVDRFLDGSGHRRLRHVASFEGDDERFVRVRALECLASERLVSVLELGEQERFGLLEALRGRLQVGRVRRLELLLHLRDRLDPPRLERRNLVIERLLESAHRRARRLHEVIVLFVQRRDGGRLPAGDRL